MTSPWTFVAWGIVLVTVVVGVTLRLRYGPRDVLGRYRTPIYLGLFVLTAVAGWLSYRHH